MNQIVAAVGVSVVGICGLLAQTGTAPSKSTAAAGMLVVKCKGPDVRPCTAKQVEALSDRVFSEKINHDYLIPVKSLTLASADGTLSCLQSDGKQCTTQQLDEIKVFGNDQKLFINYTSAKSNTAK